jgi:CheY-like chemotaxis protein
MLARAGYQTLAAQDGPSAQTQLRSRDDIALLLVDMVLPGRMSGVELVRAVSAQRSRLPVLFMTGYSNDALANDPASTASGCCPSRSASRC